MGRSVWAGLAVACSLVACVWHAHRTADASREYRQRVDTVTSIPGLVALWDFVRRENGPHGEGRFIAHTAPGDPNSYALKARNIARDYWNEGRQATYGDFPLLGRGPLGQAVRFEAESGRDFRPYLIVPRSRLDDSPLDIKGGGKSVSMVAWIILESGNHAIAGIWHEGTDLSPSTDRAALIESGRRQYALFAGLGANPGGVGAHLSENGRNSFTDRFHSRLRRPGRRTGRGLDNDRLLFR